VEEEAFTSGTGARRPDIRRALPNAPCNFRSRASPPSPRPGPTTVRIPRTPSSGIQKLSPSGDHHSIFARRLTRIGRGAEGALGRPKPTHRDTPSKRPGHALDVAPDTPTGRRPLALDRPDASAPWAACPPSGVRRPRHSDDQAPPPPTGGTGRFRTLGRLPAFRTRWRPGAAWPPTGWTPTLPRPGPPAAVQRPRHADDQVSPGPDRRYQKVPNPGAPLSGRVGARYRMLNSRAGATGGSTPGRGPVGRRVPGPLLCPRGRGRAGGCLRGCGPA
jgi:hypothetical protein